MQICIGVFVPCVIGFPSHTYHSLLSEMVLQLGDEVIPNSWVYITIVFLHMAENETRSRNIMHA